MTVSILAVPQCGVYQWLRRASPGQKSREIQDFAMMLQNPFIDRYRKSSILDTFESLTKKAVGELVIEGMAIVRLILR
jgi:hypothetical protein